MKNPMKFKQMGHEHYMLDNGTVINQKDIRLLLKHSKLLFKIKKDISKGCQNL